MVSSDVRKITDALKMLLFSFYTRSALQLDGGRGEEEREKGKG